MARGGLSNYTMLTIWCIVAYYRIKNLLQFAIQYFSECETEFENRGQGVIDF
jgi:hypothetical protein